MLNRTGTASLAAVVLVLATASAARADTGGGGAPSDSFLGQIECGNDGGAGCDIILQWMQHNGGKPGSGGEPASDDGGAEPSTPSKWDSVDWDAVDWDAVDWDAIDWESIDYSQGEDGGGEETPADPMALIVESMDSFDLPKPEISSSPATESLVLVKTPVWLWIDDQQWQPTTAEADVPDLSLELTATPRATRWTMGDGTEFTCDGPGTPYDPEVHAPDTQSPDCGHVYQRSSAAQPGGAYTVTAEITWDLNWEMSNGETGRLDTVTTASQVDLTVEESQGLVTGGGA
ncbi:ATP/GTP-binding protein [Streptomonospora sediminis]